MNASYARDLELARQCAAGEEQAWERFVLEFRPVLYRAADALDPAGGARDLADSLYADLYGMPRPPRLARDAAEQQLPPQMLSFMGESRRLDNTRLKRELRLRLRYPTVASGLRSGEASG